MKTFAFICGWLIILMATTAIYIGLSFSLGVSLSLLTYPIVIAMTLVFTARTVSSGEIFTTTLFGKYCRTLEPGLNFLIPIFERIDGNVSTKDEEVYLFIGEQNDIVMEFKDTSAPVLAKMIYRYSNPFKALYGVNSALGLAKDRIEARFKGICGKKTIDEANEGKEAIGAETAEASLIKEIEDNWGITVKRVIYIDALLSAADLAARRQVMDLRKENEKASIKVKIATKEAKIKEQEGIGEKKLLSGRGDGLAAQIEKIKKHVNNPSDVLAYLAALRKWDAVEKNEGTTIIDSSNNNNPLNTGIRFGVGHGASHGGSKKGANP